VHSLPWLLVRRNSSSNAVHLQKHSETHTIWLLIGVSDWSIIIIRPAGLLLVVPPYLTIFWEPLGDERCSSWSLTLHQTLQKHELSKEEIRRTKGTFNVARSVHVWDENTSMFVPYATATKCSLGLNRICRTSSLSNSVNSICCLHPCWVVIRNRNIPFLDGYHDGLYDS
jgi:hypothetical protein